MKSMGKQANKAFVEQQKLMLLGFEEEIKTLKGE